METLGRYQLEIKYNYHPANSVCAFSYAVAQPRTQKES